MNPAIPQAYAALQAHRFAQARDLAAPHTTGSAARLIHALARSAAGDPAAAAPVLESIARANPAARHPVHDLVDLLHAAGRSPLPALRAALALRPDDSTLLTALGAALAEHGTPHGTPQDMLAAFRQALRPTDPASLSNYAKALAATGNDQAADAAFLQARALAPTDPRLRLNHAVTRLRTGHLHEAWPLFRARHALPGRPPPPPGPELTTLDGIGGQTILLLHDEGYGDTLQFVRYARLLTARGAHVHLRVPPPLHRLLATNGFDTTDPAHHDTWCRLPDLVPLFPTIPAPIPYLQATPATHLPPGRRVGLAWAGDARAHDPAARATDRTRSIPPHRLTPLLATPGVTWINLQHATPPPPGVHDPMPAVRDFADTAAVIAALDLVISVDTAVAHLAAAMGRPTLLLDRYDNCWRWFRGRTDSPWYPGVLRILRQPTPGDWDTVLAQAATLIQP